MMWQAVPGKVTGESGHPSDTGDYGWRVGVSFKPFHYFALPVKFALKSDCERAVEFMNTECPPERDLMATVKKVEERFSGLMGWKAEVIPIACRF